MPRLIRRRSPQRPRTARIGRRTRERGWEGESVNIEIATRARRIVHDLDGSRCIFDWFAALHAMLTFRDLCGEYLAKGQEIAFRRSDFRAEHEKALLAALDEDFPNAPASVCDALRALLETLMREADANALRSDSVLDLLGAVTAIDMLFVGLGTRALSSGGSPLLSHCRARLLEDQNLASTPAVWGLVVPSASGWDVAESLPKHLNSLCHIPVLDEAAVRYQQVRSAMPLRPTPGEPLKVGFVALVQGHQELSWVFGQDKQGAPVYSVTPDSAWMGVLETRLMGSLEKLADHADLIVLPELVANEAIFRMATDWLRRRVQANQSAPSAILAGTWWRAPAATEPARNEALLIVAAQDMEVRQYKLNPYTLVHDHHAPLSLPGADPRLDYAEDIGCKPPLVELVDIPGLGRVAIQICEDLGKDHPWVAVLRHAGPKVVLCPVMNGPDKDQWDWIVRAGIDRANGLGSTVIVVNSGTMIPASGRTVEQFARGYLPKRSPTLHRFKGVAGLEWDVDGDGLVDCWVLAGSAPHLGTMQ